MTRIVWVISFQLKNIQFLTNIRVKVGLVFDLEPEQF